MEDTDLVALGIKAWGDRVALLSFAKRKKKQESTSSHILERIKSKLHTNSTKLIGNKNAKQNERRVELGWLHKENGELKQVRSKTGGGTRHIKMNVDDSIENVKEKAINLFFPKGLSRRGTVEDFDFSIANFDTNPLSENSTISELYESNGLKILRLYLCTELKQGITSEELTKKPKTKTPTCTYIPSNDTSHSEESEGIISTEEFNEKKQRSKYVDYGNSSSEILEVSFIGSPLSDDSEITFNLCNTKKPRLNKTDHVNSCSEIREVHECLADGDADTEEDSIFVDIPTDSFFFDPEELNTLSVERASNEVFVQETCTSPALPDITFGKYTVPLFNEKLNNVKPPKNHSIKLHRGHIFRELKEEFSSRKINIRCDTFDFHVILPNGEKEKAEDDGGVLRDILTEFWESFYDQCTLGKDTKVPILRHDFQEKDWKAVGSVLCFGWNAQRYFPIRLSKAFMSCCIYGVDTFSESQEELIHEFLQYMSNADSKVINDALHGSFDEDEVLDVLDNFQCRVKPTVITLKKVLGELAHKELIQKSMYVKECWFNELALQGFDLGETTLDLLYDQSLPTNKRVAKIIQFSDDMTEVQQSTAKMLKIFLREMDADLLLRFLRFCTGSDILLTNASHDYKKIQVRFVNITGIAKNPVGHTCGRVLEIPEYLPDTYMEFRSDFTAVLKSDIWIMDCV